MSFFPFNRTRKQRKPGKRMRRRLLAEALETRQLMAADFGQQDLTALSDEFDDQSSMVRWQRVHQTEGWNADQLNVWDVNQTQSGRMVMQPHTTVWYQNWRGPMAYQMVTGDFVFTTEVHVTDRDNIGGSDMDDIPGDSRFSLGGAMIRTPRDITDPHSDWTPGSMVEDGTNNGENYVFLSLGYGAGGNEFSLEVKTTRNSNSQLELTPLGSEANAVTVQIARIGDSIVTLYQLPGESWQVHRRYTRTDMPETLQVGLVSYTDWTKAGDFDPFTQNSTVLTPGMAGDPTPNEPFNPDITAGFEYARYVRPAVPSTLTGADLADPTSVTDTELLGFLGSNIGNAAVDTDDTNTETNGNNDQAVVDSSGASETNSLTPEMKVGMNLTMVNDWTHSWVFRDAFQLARDFTTLAHGGQEHPFHGPPETDVNGWVTSIPSPIVTDNGETITPYADSILFSNGGNPGGIYRAEWSGEGDIRFVGGTLVESGLAENGRHYALLDVPADQTMRTRIYETDPENYIRDIQIFMPDHNGTSLEMEPWQPGNSESPFHPLFLERLAPFDTLRFMQWQQVNRDDRVQITSDDLRPASYANQGTTNRSIYNGVSMEYQVQLVNDLGSNAYFNMPHQADESYVRAFAEYVFENIHDDAQVFVEYSNEVWNFAPEYQSHRWIMQQQQLPENAGLTFVDVWAQEARRDFAIWSDVFAGHEERLTRVAAGQQHNPQLTNALLDRMNGEFDAISSTSYAGLRNSSLEWINENTTQEDIIDWVLENSVPTSLATQAEHAQLAEHYSQTLGREIPYITYEGGSHLNAFGSDHQDLVHSAQNHPRFREVYAALLHGMEQLGISMHTQYVFTSQGNPTPWGEFGVLHEMDQPLAEAHEYNALVDFINGNLQTPKPLVSVVASDETAHELGDPAEFTVSRSNTLTSNDLEVHYTLSGSATEGEDYETLSGSVIIPAGETSARINIKPLLESPAIADEGHETVSVTLATSDSFDLDVARTEATITLMDNEMPIIGDQVLEAGNQRLEIPLMVEMGGEAITYSVSITEDLVASFQAEHQLEVFREDLGLNWGGQDEKWLRGPEGHYYILPSAEVFRWNGSFDNSTKLATLEQRFYENPILILDTQAGAADVTIIGDKLTIDPSPDFSGTFEIQLTASSGQIEARQKFNVSLENATPFIQPIEDQIILISEQTTVAVFASDTDSDNLSLSVEVQGSIASELRDEFGLQPVEGLNNWGMNWGGEQEKWLQGNNNAWFFLLPDGSLHQWAGSFADSHQVGLLGTEFYDSPQQLLDAVSAPLQVQIIDGQLRLSAQGHAGVAGVEVTVSDGITTERVAFSVQIVNTAPNLDLESRTLVTGIPLNLDLPSFDADGHAVTYSVEILGDQLSRLNEEHGFHANGNYYTNHMGNQERWIRNRNGNWHFLLPDGGLYRWQGSFSNSTVIAQLGSHVYEDPTLLTDPVPVPVIATRTDDGLTMETTDEYTGQISVRINASDGYETISQIIQITVIASDDVDAAFASDMNFLF